MELAPPPLPIQMPFQIMNNLLNGHAGTSSTIVHKNLLTSLGGGANQLQASNSNASSTHQTLNFNSQNTLTTPSTSHDVGKSNNGTETNSTSSLKGSFRCGHCGQISNWKHVIQVQLTDFPPRQNIYPPHRLRNSPDKPNPFDDKATIIIIINAHL